VNGNSGSIKVYKKKPLELLLLEKIVVLLVFLSKQKNQYYAYSGIVLIFHYIQLAEREIHDVHCFYFPSRKGKKQDMIIKKPLSPEHIAKAGVLISYLSIKSRKKWQEPALCMRAGSVRFLVTRLS
jgi:hypothetical protein